jgi:hypothetical protein
MNITSAEDMCGCCQIGVPLTPEKVYNRPGLSAIGYRIGTYASFREAMVEGIGSYRVKDKDKTLTVLNCWTYRSNDDYGIALLDMWAYLADILTFYQERIANEAYLRTAILLESVRRLAALLDYKLSPGVAAEAFLAFTTEKDKTVQIPKDLLVQSVPGQNEKPQKFETADAIIAEADLNLVRIFPKPEPFEPLDQGGFVGMLNSTPPKLSAGDRLVIFNKDRAEIKAIQKVYDRDGLTIINWAPPIQEAGFKLFTADAAPYRRQLMLFGYNAPDSFLAPESTNPLGQGDIKWVLKKNILNLSPNQDNTLNLDSRYDDLKPGTMLLLVDQEHHDQAFTRLAKVAEVASGLAKISAVNADQVKSSSSSPNTAGSCLEVPNPADYWFFQDMVTKVTLDLGIGGTVVSSLDASDCLQVFCIGDDGALWVIKREKISDPWTDWISLGGHIDLLSVVRGSAGRLEIFARGVDKALWHIRQLSDSKWSEWESLGGQIDMLAAGINKDKSLEVFARGIDNILRYLRQKTPDGEWSNWITLADPMNGPIDMLAIGSNGDGFLEIFARGADKALWHVKQLSLEDNKWGDWQSLGNQIDMLMVGTSKDRLLEIFARGMDKALWHIWQKTDKGDWSGWATLGGPLNGPIDMLAVGNSKDGSLQVFARSMDRVIWNISQLPSSKLPDSVWGKWVCLWNPPSGAVDMPAVVLNEDGSMEILARGKDKALWNLKQNDPVNGWHNGDSGDKWISLGVPIQPIHDLRKVTIFELGSQPLQFWNLRYPEVILKGDGVVYVPSIKPESVEPKRALIFDDREIRPQTVIITDRFPFDLRGKGSFDYLAIAFAPPLKRSLDSATAMMFGNVTKASHGETVKNEVLGDANASLNFQTFLLSKFPVTFVRQEGATHGAANTLNVWVDGLQWHEVRDFYDLKPDDRVFKTEIDSSRKMTVIFGNGINGARPTSGRGNVTATYRQGIGHEGNVGEGSLKTLLNKPVGLKSVVNPGPASGGADAEPMDAAKKNAPNTVRTFDRIISLRDFEDAAREFAGLAKARSSWEWGGEEQVVKLVVACSDDADLSDELKKQLIAYLNVRRDTNLKMKVQDRRKVPVLISVGIDVDPDRVKDQILSLVNDALKSYFSFENRCLGSPVHLSDVYRVIQGVNGVGAGLVRQLQFKDMSYEEMTKRNVRFHKEAGKDVPDPVQDHLLAYPEDIIVIENANADISVVLGV